MSEDRKPTCICCGKVVEGFWSDVTMKKVIVLPEGLKGDEFDWSIWEDSIGVKVPMCTKCIKELELNNDRKIYCAAMAIKLHPQVCTVFCSKCPDFMMMPLVCSDCLRKTFKKILKEAS